MSESIGIDKLDLRQMSKAKISEADTLLKNNHYVGCIYMGGYALELALKARICKHLGIERYLTNKDNNFFKTHNIERLTLLAGLNKLKEKREDEVDGFKDNWVIVTNNWSEQLRYSSPDSKTIEDAEAFMEALTNRDNGVITWLKEIW